MSGIEAESGALIRIWTFAGYGAGAFLNFIILGGRSTDKLFRLSDEIMNETGLACPVTTDLKECLKDRQLVILIMSATSGY